mmetsp:Transcript_41129/g.106138  ORF Transcript_41129/g.106138 Transcript_41129/m.106138 type:complete len:203 (+) Transcript_41129:3-611(+)
MKAQAEMDSIRRKEHDLFVKSEADLKQGLTGVQSALKILNEYYASQDKAHSAADGSATGIIGLLEVVESDFSKGLAEASASEDSSASEHDRETRENKVEMSMKDRDVEYKTKESASLDKDVAELTSDRSGAQAELDAVLEYWARLQEQCIAKAESFSERKSRREAEIAGLKEALRVLDSETALLQRHASRRKAALRGHVIAA